MNCLVNNYTYDEIEIGHKESFEVKITEDMLEKFKSVTGDINPLHNDEDYAREKGHPSRVVYGMLTASFLSTLAGVYLPGKRSLIHQVEIKMEKPVYVGDTITIEGSVKEKNDTFSFIVVKVTARNQDGKKVMKATMQVGVE